MDATVVIGPLVAVAVDGFLTWVAISCCGIRPTRREILLESLDGT